MFAASTEWIAKWPDSKTAWQMRRNAMVSNRTASAQDWKQVGESLIRLNPPHSIASSIAYDWIAADVNVPEAEAMITSEIAWQEQQPQPTPSSSPPAISDLRDEAYFHSRLFPPLLTLAQVQIKLKEFDAARVTISRVRAWLDGEFKRYYDQDPLEAYPDYQAKPNILSARLAVAEGKTLDALAYDQPVITNPYFRREYNNDLGAKELWKKAGGTDEGFAVFSKVGPFPSGTPSGYPGLPFQPWLAMNYKLPELFAPGPTPGSHTWTLKDFVGKTTLVYVWAAGCGGLCSQQFSGIQALYEKIIDRTDIQMVTLSTDEDMTKLAAFMKDNHYTFPVIANKTYVERLIPQPRFGQDFIVDATGSIRLYRMNGGFRGPAQAYVDEAIYKLTQLAVLASASSTASADVRY